MIWNVSVRTVTGSFIVSIGAPEERSQVRRGNPSRVGARKQAGVRHSGVRGRAAELPDLDALSFHEDRFRGTLP